MTVFVIPFSIAQFHPISGQKALIWHQAPFFSLGDIGQFEDTSKKGRDQIRSDFISQLMRVVSSLNQTGVSNPELLIEPVGNLLLLLDQLYDVRKSKDVILVDSSLETQFKGHLDQLYRKFQIPDNQRVLEFINYSQSNVLASALHQLNQGLRLGEVRDRTSFQNLKGLISPLQYTAFGTFSNLGRGFFQVTLHITNLKNGSQRNFSVNASLQEAPKLIALQVFDFFQKQIFQDWIAIHPQLQWLAAPFRDPARGGFSFSEALSYCRSRGYRLPFARELVLAETGSSYRPGGIGPLSYRVSYPVADRRLSVAQYVYTLGLESATGGPVHGASYIMSRGLFYCVKGSPAPDVKLLDEIWALIRKHRQDHEIYQALESLRFYLGDFGLGDSIRFGPEHQSLPFLESPQEAIEILKRNGISLYIPKGIFS